MRPSPARELTSILLAAVLLPAAVVSTTAAVAGSVSSPSASRQAADRACPAAPPEKLERFEAGRFSLVEVGWAVEPTSLALRPGHRGDGVLGERPGRVLAVADGQVTGEVLLDLSDDTTNEGDGGLLAVAYDPDDRWLYVYRATRGRDDVVTAFPLDDAGRPQQEAGRELLRVDHPPSEQHHGGGLAFGPDGLLYVGFGDGGGLGDPGENAQDPSTLLGKVVRIDPTPAAATPYRVPADNPFVDQPGRRPEIWVRGVRNPFRASVDAATGDLWLGDVGQSCWEEIDRLAPDAGGANLGWDRLEGTEEFEGGELPGPDLEPVLTRSHLAGWCAIVPGYVPRGDAVASLDGWLLITDYCAGRIVVLDTEAEGDEPVLRDLGLVVDGPVAIVPGPAGPPWVLSLEDPILELRPR